jgi:protein TonB
VLAFWLLTILEAALPKLLEGDVPDGPLSGREGAFAILELRISPEGTVVEVAAREGEPGLAELLRERVLGWRFESARDDEDEPVASTVSLTILNRAPALGGALPPLPKTPRPADSSSEVAFPTRMAMPPLPPQATLPGVVLLECAVGEDGAVDSAKAIRSSGGFDGVALDTIEDWRFEPARRGSAAVASRAYALFGFRPPRTN